MDEELSVIIGSFTLKNLIGSIGIKLLKGNYGLVVAGESEYLLKKPITGTIEYAYDHFYVGWEPNPKGKNRLEQGSPIISSGETLQDAFDEFLDCLTDVFDDTIQTPDEKWHASALDYNKNIKDTISKRS